jgi:hypothetical protein
MGSGVQPDSTTRAMTTNTGAANGVLVLERHVQVAAFPK